MKKYHVESTFGSIFRFYSTDTENFVAIRRILWAPSTLIMRLRPGFWAGFPPRSPTRKLTVLPGPLVVVEGVSTSPWRETRAREGNGRKEGKRGRKHPQNKLLVTVLKAIFKDFTQYSFEFSEWQSLFISYCRTILWHFQPNLRTSRSRDFLGQYHARHVTRNYCLLLKKMSHFQHR